MRMRISGMTLRDGRERDESLEDAWAAEATVIQKRKDLHYARENLKEDFEVVKSAEVRMGAPCDMRMRNSGTALRLSRSRGLCDIRMWISRRTWRYTIAVIQMESPCNMRLRVTRRTVWMARPRWIRIEWSCDMRTKNSGRIVKLSRSR